MISSKTNSRNKHVSFWTDSESLPSYAAVNKDLKTDVLIIGGGISGLTTAYELLKQGKKIIIVEDRLIGSGESGRTTAHLTCALDDRFFILRDLFGDDVKRIAQSHVKAIDRIGSIVDELKIDCHFKRVDGFLFLHPSDQRENLEKELVATQDAGLATQWMEYVPGIERISSPCIRFPDQAQFHIMKYLKGLADAIISMGGEIYTSSRASDISEKGVVCNGFTISADDVVVATNTPVNNMVTMHTKQFAFRTYVTAFKVPKGSLPAALWWDTGDQESEWYTSPYHYVRTEKYNDEYDLLISGGEDHKTGQAEDIPEEDRYERLMMWTKKHFPMAGTLAYQWSGQVMEPLDQLAFIGKNPGNDHVYIVTGDSGNGMTHGTIAGMLITDLIMGKENAWEKMYSPKRIPLKKTGRFLKEIGNMVKQYGDWFDGNNIEELNQLAADDGMIISKDMKKYAVYKDEHHELTIFSAVCPHLGCVLRWNGDEKTFDCPCHGSRFDKRGEVINGPAITGLKQINSKELKS